MPETNHEITHVDIYRALGTLEGKVDGFLQMEVGRQKAIDDHEERLRGLEASKHRVIGAGSVVSAIIAFLVTYFTK